MKKTKKMQVMRLHNKESMGHNCLWEKMLMQLKRTKKNLMKDNIEMMDWILDYMLGTCCFHTTMEMLLEQKLKPVFGMDWMRMKDTTKRMKDTTRRMKDTTKKMIQMKTEHKEKQLKEQLKKKVLPKNKKKEKMKKTKMTDLNKMEMVCNQKKKDCMTEKSIQRQSREQLKLPGKKVWREQSMLKEMLMKESTLILKMVMKKLHTKDKKREQHKKVVLKMLWKKMADLENIHLGLSMKLEMKRALDKNLVLNTMQGQETGVEKRQLEVGMTDCYNHFQRRKMHDKTGEQVVCILDSGWNKKRSHHLHHCFHKRLVVIELVA